MTEADGVGFQLQFMNQKYVVIVKQCTEFILRIYIFHKQALMNYLNTLFEIFNKNIVLVTLQDEFQPSTALHWAARTDRGKRLRDWRNLYTTRDTC